MQVGVSWQFQFLLLGSKTRAMTKVVRALEPERVGVVGAAIVVVRLVAAGLVTLQRRVDVVSHAGAHVVGNGVLLDVDEPGVHDLAVDLHHGHVVGWRLH